MTTPTLPIPRVVKMLAARENPLTVTPQTVRTWCKKGKIPGYTRTEAGAFLIPLDAVAGLPPAPGKPGRRKKEASHE